MKSSRRTSDERDEKKSAASPVRISGMASLADVFRVLNQMRDSGVVTEYAVGGATAVLFYAEPTRTYDVGVFVTLQEGGAPLLSIAPVYRWAEEQGFAVQAEHLMIHGVPVQILPSFNPLVEEAVIAARLERYDDVSVRVVGPEHLVALALQAGGARRRERAWQLLQAGVVDRPQLTAILVRHGVRAEIPNDV